MFWKRKIRIKTCTGEILETDYEIQKYIRHIETEKLAIQKELDAIIPIIEDPRIVPAISKECEGCKFAVFGTTYFTTHANHLGTGKQLLGCRKDGLCDDFVAVESE